MKKDTDRKPRPLAHAALVVAVVAGLCLAGCWSPGGVASDGTGASSATSSASAASAASSAGAGATASSGGAASSSSTAGSNSGEASSAGSTQSKPAAVDASRSSSGGSAAAVAGFQALDQYPELPNGCEITSLAAVLNYNNFDVDKLTLSDVYLNKAPVGEANFHREFVGDPRDEDAYGCYSPVIVDAANSYLQSVGSNLRAHDITGSSPDQLYRYIDKNTPVIVWATRYMEPGYYSVTWTVDGQDYTWYTPEHCLVLVGYDNDADTVQLADPMEGKVVDYDRDLFETRYAELQQQAVVIE